MVNQETFDRLLPLACAWARAQEEFVLSRGVPLDARYLAEARRLGVKDCARIKVLIVEKIPLPDDADLADAARRGQIITDTSRAVAIGYAIIIRADCWGDRELILHQLVHVAQSERCGGLDRYLEQYLSDRHTCARFTIGSFEEEARRVAHEICAAATEVVYQGAA